MTVVNCLRSIRNNTIMFDNALPLGNWTFLFDGKVKYVENIIVSRDTAHFRIGSKDAIQVISEIGEDDYYVQ